MIVFSFIQFSFTLRHADAMLPGFKRARSNNRRRSQSKASKWAHTVVWQSSVTFQLLDWKDWLQKQDLSFSLDKFCNSAGQLNFCLKVPQLLPDSVMGCAISSTSWFCSCQLQSFRTERRISERETDVCFLSVKRASCVQSIYVWWVLTALGCLSRWTTVGYQTARSARNTIDLLLT